MKVLQLLLIAFLFLSCSARPRENVGVWFEENGKVKALSTTAMIGALVQRIGGDHVDNLTLVIGELDPHTYQLVKGDDEKLNFADLIFYNGLGLEHGPSLRYHLENNPRSLALGDAVQIKFPERILKVEGQVDPHIWMDISLWRETVPLILDALAKQDPVHAESYRQNAAALLKELDSAHASVRATLQAIPDEKRYLVTSHDAFNYFSRAYLATDAEVKENRWQSRFEAPEGLAPESQLSVSDIQVLVRHLEKYRIHVLFPESNVSKDSIRKIVSAGNEKGLNLRIASKPIYGDAMGEKGSGADTYPGMIETNAKTISGYLQE